MAPAGVALEPIPGVVRSDLFCRVRHPDGGESLIFNDSLFNVPHCKGLNGLLLRLTGSSGPLHMSPLARLFLLRDKQAFRAFLQGQSRREGLRNVIVGHGEVVSRDAQARLASAAARL